VEGEADGEVERNPREIEQRRRARARQERADRIEVADRLLAIASRLGPRAHDRIEDPRAYAGMELVADAHEQTAARDVQQALEREQDGGQHRQGDQRGHAAARQDTIVDLQHEQRPRQHQHVDQAAECADAEKSATARRERTPQLGFRTGTRSRLHHLPPWPVTCRLLLAIGARPCLGNA
jgi:hypothetical protein